MRKGPRILGGAGVVALSLALAVQAMAAKADFVLSNANVSETVYTFNSMPLSCVDYPAGTDSYSWKVRLGRIKGDFIQDLANNIILIAYNSGTCNPVSDVTNTLEIPPAAVFIHVDPQGLVDVDFDGSVPDFNTVNTSNDIGFPFFDSLGFHMVYNPKTGTIGGLAPGTGTLEVTGNANLCGTITSNQPQQCFLLDLNFGDEADNDIDFGCVCTTPTVQSIDLTSFLSE